MLKRPLVRRPIGHPLGVNPAGVLLFRSRALGGVSVAESTVLLRAAAKASTFHPIPLPSIHPSIHPSISLLLYSWFEGAETAPGPQTNGPPLGPESCWGSAVPQPCPGRCFCSRIHGAAHSGCAMLSMAVLTVLFRQLNPQCCSGPLYFNPSTHYVNPSTHPRPKLPPPPTHPSLCF